MRFNRAILLPLAFGLLTACGGGSSGGGGVAPPAGTAEGLWRGTTSTNQTVIGIVLDNGAYWFLYSIVGNSAVLGGLAQGNGVSNNGTFTSSNAKSFDLTMLTVTDGSIDSNYAANSTFDGTVTANGGGSLTFNTAYDVAFDQSPSLATIAGTYTGTSVDFSATQAATVVVTGGGALSGIAANGCHFNGTVTTHASGNVYDVTVTFGAGCASSSTITGIAYFDSATNTIYTAALNGTRDEGGLFYGTKP